ICLLAGFRPGSIPDPELLAGEGPFDVVVCFEAIGHVEDHDAVLQLARQRLAPGGLLLISTPDTRVYSGEHGNDNPYHVRELTGEEFQQLLEGSFRYVALLKQNVAVGSLAAPAEPGAPDTALAG